MKLFCHNMEPVVARAGGVDADLRNDRFASIPARDAQACRLTGDRQDTGGLGRSQAAGRLSARRCAGTRRAEDRPMRGAPPRDPVARPAAARYRGRRRLILRRAVPLSKDCHILGRLRMAWAGAHLGDPVVMRGAGPPSRAARWQIRPSVKCLGARSRS